MGKKIRAAVKGSPVINDSTMFDAEESGLTKICEVIENGSECNVVYNELGLPQSAMLLKKS